MFNTARLKLTAWYLLIIMFISMLFSLVIFAVINQEYSRIERAQRIRLEREQQGLISRPEFRILRRDLDDLQISKARTRLVGVLLLVNLGILGIAGGLSYFLAGRTLRPIEEMLDEQNRFITDASHELRTPLTSLKSEIEVNLRDKHLNITDAKKILASNLEEVDHLQLLSDNLIKLTQYKKTNRNIPFEELRLDSVIEEAGRKVAKLAKYKNIDIKNNVEAQSLEGERQSLIELMVIFLDNAIKYSKKNTQIILDSKLSGHNIEISIKDEGVGIGEQEIPHLFDRFYRTDKSRAKDISGYGLGLSIAKQIIDQHDGFIKVESKIGKGTIFYITLPLRQSGRLR